MSTEGLQIQKIKELPDVASLQEYVTSSGILRNEHNFAGIIFKGIFHTHKEGHGCQCLSSADIVYIRSIMNAYVKKLYFPIVIPHTGVFPYLAVYDQLSGLSITPEELNLTL